MRLIEAFIHNPIKVAVGVLIVTLFGMIALFRMPMQLTPEVETPTLTITTMWPGASPQEVEREIILEQEEQLKGVEGVSKMSSESMDSRGQITLEFSIGTDMNEALLTVNSRLAQVREYPEDADQPVISTSNVSDRPIAYFTLETRAPSREELLAAQQEYPQLTEPINHVLRAHSPPLALYRLEQLAEKHPELRSLLAEHQELTQLRRFVEDNIEARFERVDGVSQAEVSGGRMEELQVIVDPEKLAARQLTIYDVRNALRNENRDTSGGDFWEGKRRYVVRTLGQFTSPQEVEEVLIAVRTGAPVYVRDVARVVLGYKKPDSIVRRFGRSGINISVSRETGANVLDVMAGLRQVTADLNENLLAARGLQLLQVYDETDYINAAIGLVQSNIVVGGLLTIVVLLLFLRSGRSTLVISLAIPISIVGTFLLLHLMGRSLNVVSLAGLAFAVGMLVDNAVVVLENIFTHYQRSHHPFRAAVEGAQEVWGAVVASTLTTLAVFLPVLFVQEEAGQLFRDIALAISAAVGLSMVVSIIVIPVGASRILALGNSNPDWHRPGEKQVLSVPYQSHRALDEKSESVNGNGHQDPGAVHRPPRAARSRGRLLGQATLNSLTRPFDWLAERFVRGIVGINRWLQQSIARQTGGSLVMIGAAVLICYLLIPKVEYLPVGNRNLVFGNLLPPPGYNLDQLQALGHKVEEQLIPYWDVDLDSEAAQDRDRPPVIGDFFFMARGRRVFMGMRSVDPSRASELIPLVRRVTADLPGTFGVAKQSSLFERGRSAGRTIEVEVRGPDLHRLVELGGRILAMAEDIVPGSQLLPIPSLDLSSPEVHVRPLRQRAKELQMDATELGYTVDAMVDGAYAADYYIGGEKIDLTIVGQNQFVERTQDLKGLPVATASGKLVTLSALAEIDPFGTGPEQVNRRERQRAVTIQVTPPIEIPLEEAQDRIRTQIVQVLQDEGALEGGYRIDLEGTANKLRQTWEALRFNVFLALMITYLLMAALFESWLYPLVIILTVPLGAVGGIGALWLLNWFVLQPLDVLTMLGFVMLIGTVVNNPILIVHQSLNHLRRDGMSPAESVLESVRGRIRPIFMTTLTTVLGLMPLVVYPGQGSELYRGMGAVVLGGLLVSTVFTLVLVPSLFSLTMHWRSVFLHLLFGGNHHSASGAAPPAADASRGRQPVSAR